MIGCFFIREVQVLPMILEAVKTPNKVIARWDRATPSVAGAGEWRVHNRCLERPLEQMIYAIPFQSAISQATAARPPHPRSNEQPVDRSSAPYPAAQPYHPGFILKCWNLINRLGQSKSIGWE